MSLMLVRLVIYSTGGASSLIDQRFGEVLKQPGRVRGSGNKTGKWGPGACQCKVKLSFTSLAVRHEEEPSGSIDPHFLDVSTSCR
jgi:hypothetical protein